MAKRRRMLLAGLAVLVATVTGGSAANAEMTPSATGKTLTVATYNLYLGANLTPIFKAGTQADMVAQAAIAYQHMLQVDFPARAEAIATLLAAHPADVVGLQEVALWEAGPIGGPFEPTMDYLAVLRAALAAHGLEYEVAAENTNFTGEMPISGTEAARFTDHDAVLVRTNAAGPKVVVRAHESGEYTNELVIPSATGVTFTVPRGWSTVDLTVCGRTVRLADTHLEAYSNTLRDAQAGELQAKLAGSPYPVVLLGDFNSRITDTGTAPYPLFTGSGYADSWATVTGSTDGGFTAGQTDDLNNLPSKLDHRVDYVFTGAGLTADQATVIGDQVADMTPSGLWPSDHAGLVVRVELPSCG